MRYLDWELTLSLFVLQKHYSYLRAFVGWMLWQV